MIEMNNTRYYKPKEIADNKMIVNSKGRGDYGFVLRLIKSGKLKAQTFNEDSKIAYYMVPETEIKRYTDRFSV